MGKKRITIILIAIGIAIGAYFGVGHLMGEGPGTEPNSNNDGLLTGFGIAQSSIEFRNVYPGWNGTAPLTIINGQVRDRVFWVSLEQPNPDKLKEGYQSLPEKYYSWITINGWDGAAVTSEPEVVLKAGERHELTLVLTIPEDIDYADKRAEVRVRVSDLSQTGLVQVAVETRWYIIVAE